MVPDHGLEHCSETSRITTYCLGSQRQHKRQYMKLPSRFVNIPPLIEKTNHKKRANKNPAPLVR